MTTAESSPLKPVARGCSLALALIFFVVSASVPQTPDQRGVGAPRSQFVERGATPGPGPTALFVRGGSGTGGLAEGGDDDHLCDITNASTANGNHGWKELADALEADGFALTQVIEGPVTNNTPIDFGNMDLDQYDVIVLGSNNADYPTASIDAIEDWVRAGGGLLAISDANFGTNWGDAPTSDQLFFDRFGLIMNQDQGTYDLTRSNGDFAEQGESHPILTGVDKFDGEGVSPISVGTLTTGVTATVLAPAQGLIRENDAQNQGSIRPVNAMDGALVAATADAGRIVGHFDRNTFFNLNGAGTNIRRFDNTTYALNVFRWLAGTGIPLFNDGFEGGDTGAWQ